MTNRYHTHDTYTYTHAVQTRYSRDTLTKRLVSSFEILNVLVCEWYYKLRTRNDNEYSVALLYNDFNNVLLELQMKSIFLI